MYQMQPVASSNLDEIGHDEDGLLVRFKNGQLWRYRGVSEATYQALQAAPSIGSAFHKLVRSQYQGEKVDG